MNYPLVTITINNSIAFADKPLCFFIGDKGAVMTFKVVNPQYKLTKADEDDYLVSTGATKYKIVMTSKTQRIDGVMKSISNKQLSITASASMTNAAQVFDFQITLFDDNESEIMSLPVVKAGVIVKEKI